MPVTIAVDLGKTRCRVAVMDAGDHCSVVGIGAPGLAAAAGVEAALAAILPLIEQLGSSDVIGVGAAGAWAAPDAAADLARALAEATGADVAVASDVVTAHAGALEGDHGTLLIAGTGAAALGADADGMRLIDGWGPDLGDLGGGSWIGREGMRATLRARDGLGLTTTLSAAVSEHIAPSTDALTWLAADIPTARRLAAVAPLVLDAASAEDTVAAAIVAEAVRLLTATAVAASTGPRVVVHGGLADHVGFRAELDRALRAAGRTIAPAAGDALHGAALLAARTDLPHERFVHRA